MALMTFDIPDGMTAQVIVGTPDSFARREPLQIAYEAAHPEPRHKRRSRWFMLTSAGILLLVGGMFLGGSLRPHNSANAAVASLPPPMVPAPVSPDGPPPATTAFPLQAPAAPAPPPSFASSGSNAPPATESGAPAGQMPPDLAADLKAQPQVEPAPGQASGQGAAPPPPQNAFGLGN